MSPDLTLETERVDDLPLLLAQIQHMGLPALFNHCFPPQRRWQGLDPGWVTSVWLAFILSRGDHRLSHVQSWVERRRYTLGAATGETINELDWADDRLAAVLRLLSQDEPWQQFERLLAHRLVRVYDLETDTVRIDTTSASGFWSLTEGGLFQFGHSKDHRPIH